MEIILCETMYRYVIENYWSIYEYIQYIHTKKKKELITVLHKDAFTNRI